LRSEFLPGSGVVESKNRERGQERGSGWGNPPGERGKIGRKGVKIRVKGKNRKDGNSSRRKRERPKNHRRRVVYGNPDQGKKNRGGVIGNGKEEARGG